MDKSVTVEDVARRAGVSRQTVSNVLNSPEVVRPATRERVEHAIAELRYAPSVAARRLRTKTSHTIAVRLDPYAGGISGVVLDRFIHALTDRATPRGQRILVYSTQSESEEIDRLRTLHRGGEIDRVVLLGTFAEDPRMQAVTALGLPFVSFGRPWKSSDAQAHEGRADLRWVDVDGASGIAAATRSVAGENIAFLGWPRGSGTGDDRERGWRENAGSSADRWRWSAQEQVVDAKRVVEAHLHRGDRPDAVVCASDTLAVGAHLALAHAGFGGLPVFGFDNTPVAEALGISSIEQRPEAVAEAVLDLLDADPDSYAGPWGMLITPALVRRSPVFGATSP